MFYAAVEVFVCVLNPQLHTGNQLSHFLSGRKIHGNGNVSIDLTILVIATCSFCRAILRFVVVNV